MNRKLFNRLGIGAIALLFVGAILWTVTLQAGAGRPGTLVAPGTTISNAALATGSPIPGFPTNIRVGNTCTVPANMEHVLKNFTGIRFATSGFKSSVVGQPVTTTNGLRGFTTTVAAFSSKASTSASKAVGTLDIQFDPRNPGVTSTVISNQTSAPFPATLNSFFHATFTLDGKTYASIKPVHLQATIAAFPPPRGTQFSLVEDLQAANVSNSSDVITVLAGQVAIIT